MKFSPPGKHTAAPCWWAAALHLCLSAIGCTDLSFYSSPHFIFSTPSSVEALASTLVPLAVDHQADDDEEDAAQHGEEHGEENGYATHPFFSRAHWK